MVANASGNEVLVTPGAAGYTIAIYDSATDEFRTSTAFGYIGLAAASLTGTQFALLTPTASHS